MRHLLVSIALVPFATGCTSGALSVSDTPGVASATTQAVGSPSPAPLAFSSTGIAGESQTSAIALGDLDGDGVGDLVDTDDQAGTIGVRLGRSDGTFGTVTRYAVGGHPRSIAIADLDADGANDLAIAVSDGVDGRSIATLANDGHGHFTITGFWGTGLSCNSVAAGDLDGDGSIDLVGDALGDDAIFVLFNSGTGTFDGPSSANGDGVTPDLVVADLADEEVTVIRTTR